MVNAIYINALFIAIIVIAYVSKRTTINNRPIWYQPKKLFTTHAGKEGDDSSQQLFDPYSLTHIFHGIIFYNAIKYGLGITNTNTIILYAMLIEILWELIENTEYIINKYRRTVVSRNYPGDSWINSVGDVWMAYIGVLIAMNFPLETQLILVSAIEIFLYKIRGDNLLTNIIQVITF